MNEANESQTTASAEGKQRRVGVAYHAVFGLPVAEMQRKYYLGYAEAKRVAEEAVKRQMTLLEASRCIRHWHDTSYNPETGETEGMIVSAQSVRNLWEARSALDEEVWPNDQAMASAALASSVCRSAKFGFDNSAKIPPFDSCH